MRLISRLAVCSVLGAISVSLPAHADSSTQTFAVMRGDDRIGTNTIKLESAGPETNVQIITHVEVKALFLTLYHFDLTESERWLNGRLVAMKSDADDNGTVYRTNAACNGTELVVTNGSGAKRVAQSIVPASLWNSAVLAQSEALDPKNGNLVPMKVVDLGMDSVVVGGRTVRAHHYSITTTFSQDVWYDADRHFLQLQMKASDGSMIRYQRV